ncbi:LacI family DNA-binding transcriptional regulator [Nostoc sp. FACHB-152]|uniref:LacI family DNA-binding transcriptional regulator n=1 Tax=unclassified Nostoc TaxID=2593658 RepID=UPI001681EB30|nr:MULTISPECIES: LacI family DNA-binding transcriptional regulator [unclassified Nostoc]MBD2449395.1 LacI family DNA-binding transcriptional regulator [Nostoc sp. FACHB-152]MBD2470690.1 LacI family DNA-binding transcriptional regulator [Nostoc sp. FACHB-145]
MSKRKVSIEDIARQAGVSHSTVSRALRDSPLISAKVREEIKKLAQEMNYVPNAIAQSLQTQRTYTVGVVVTSIADPFFGELVEGIEQVARQAGLNVLLSASHGDFEQEIAAIENFNYRRVDGILIADSRINKEYTKQLTQLTVPTVLINIATEELRDTFHSVALDDRLGGTLAVEHLINLGHTSIGYLSVGDGSKADKQRLEGYRIALNHTGIPENSDWVVIPHQDHETIKDIDLGKKMLPQLVKAGVTAIFCYNDMVAVGALLACRELGISVPQDLSLVGFDNIALSSYVTPPLTTVSQRMLEMGKLAMTMLLDLFQEKPVENLLLSPFLVQRDSTTTVNKRKNSALAKLTIP